MEKFDLNIVQRNTKLHRVGVLEILFVYNFPMLMNVLNIHQKDE
jgi:hypothetical protein